MACSPEITALIPLAVEVVLIAFRVGRLVRTAARHIEVTRTEDSAASWSFVIPGVTHADAKAALSTFNQSKVHSTTHTWTFKYANYCHRIILNVIALT